MKRLLAAWLTILLLTAPAWGASFDFRDEFTTDRAAGAVNGTAADPGTGNRTATDSNSKLTISSGVLSFATGGAAAGDPGLWYPITTRSAGTGIIASVTPDGTSNASISVGWDSNQAGVITDGFNFAASGDLTWTGNGGTARSSTSYTATEHLVGVFQRASGAFGFFKKPSSVWKLGAIGHTGNGNLYPAYSALGTSAIATSAYARIPSTRWLPTPIISDGFGTSGTSDGLGHPETTGLGSGGSGLTWTGGTGSNWTTSGGSVSNSPTLGSNLFANSTFDSDTDWTKVESWTIHDGIADPGGGNAGTLRQAVCESNKWYNLRFDVITRTAGFFSAYVGGNLVNPVVNSVSSNNTRVGRASGGSATLAGVYAANSTTGTIDNAYIKEVSVPSTFRLFNWPTGSTPSADAIFDVTLTANPTGVPVGILCNLDSLSNPQNYIIAYYDGINVKVDEVVAGSPTNKLSAAYTWAAGTRLRLVRDGTEMRIYTYNGTAWALMGTAKTMTANTNTNHGLFATGDTAGLDNFVAYYRGTGGEYAALDTMNTLPSNIVRLDGATLSTSALIDTAIEVVGNDSALEHVSLYGDVISQTGVTGTSATNFVNDGVLQLGENWTCDQVATTETDVGAGDCSEALISLSASPFRSSTDLRPKRNARDVWCGGVDAGISIALDGKTIPYRGCYPIGAYFPRMGDAGSGMGGMEPTPDF